jgi:ubiquinone/menaquinone biosynthesis C-methylase UbiE
MNESDAAGRSPFDVQGTEFDRRAGLLPETCRRIADAAYTTAGVRPVDLVLEVGAGTGLLGEGLAVASRGRYLGLDLSLGMLETFRRRDGGAWLALADANQPWPLAGGSARLIFSSRTIHWLDPEHTVEELLRVARPGAFLLVGRVERHPDGVRSRLRREMRRRLGQLGRSGRSGRRSGDRIFELCCQRGAELLESATISQWTRGYSPRQALAAWRGKPGLAGLDLPQGVKRDVLQEVEDWATATFGDLDAEIVSEESYVLEGVRLTP